MYRTTIEFHKKLQSGEIPLLYIMITTAMGVRVYAEKDFGSAFSTTLAQKADGTYEAGGAILADGGEGVSLEQSARLLSVGSFDRTIADDSVDVLTAYATKKQQACSITLDNADRYFSRLIAAEPFIGMPINVYIGFFALPRAEHISLFRGRIVEMDVMPTLLLEAEEI